MTRAILLAVALASCSAQATEPELKDSERLSIERFIDERCNGTELACQLECDNTFITSKDDLRWAMCSSLVAKKYEEGGA